ncbi:RNA polymerase-associated protein RapA [Symmachiella dynata]|uniref:RNA polymerase-associated protein RapA n=1 Tax=Symmachiella dynata TaxID=2527995 RepID=A0A517ZWH4_9PLAN|nr:helicase-related protein [Symmachiella dynata]QDU46852.1 RNA polymerase-associated protein RapA [Symmachiella dynata]
MNKSEITTAFLELGCFPHQAEFAADFLAADSKQKHLLTSLPGLGKGFIGSQIVAYAFYHSQAKRVLVLAPMGIAQQWCDMLQRNSPEVPCRFVDRRRLREMVAGEDDDLWMNTGVVVMSIDFARQADVAELLSKTIWDLIVVDEAHHLRPKTQRYELVQRLFESSPQARSLLLHALSKIPDGEGVANPLFHDAKVTVWSRDTVRDNDGNPLLPDVQIKWIHHVRRDDEQQILLELQACIRRAGVKEPRSQLEATALLQTASSSLLALEQRLSQMQRVRNETVHGLRDVASKSDDVEIEPESADENLDGQSLAQSSFMDDVPRLLAMLEEVETDSKLESLLELLHTIGVSSSGDMRICVFTSYVNTATYLESALSDNHFDVTAITGSSSYGEREQIIADFSQNGGVLVCTSAMTVRIPEVAAVIFYDLPWNPATVDARIGQFLRVGRPGPVGVYAFTDDSDTLVIERLQKKVNEIKQSLGSEEIQKLLFDGEIDQ